MIIGIWTNMDRLIRIKRDTETETIRKGNNNLKLPTAGEYWRSNHGKPKQNDMTNYGMDSALWGL